MGYGHLYMGYGHLYMGYGYSHMGYGHLHRWANYDGQFIQVRIINNLVFRAEQQIILMASFFTEGPHTRHSRNKSNLSNSKLPKSLPKVGEYIDHSMARIDKGSYIDGKLTIDGGYGDYRMSIFRLKDRKKRMNELPTIFTKAFVDAANCLAPDSSAKLDQIVRTPNQIYLDRHVEDVEKGREQKFIKMHWKEEEGEQLIYQYVPEYQREKWFSKTVDHCEPVRMPPPQPPTHRPMVLRSKKMVRPTHIFRFLDLQKSSGTIESKI